MVEFGRRCNREIYGHGYCNKHWKRWRRYGDPLSVKQVKPDSALTPEENFMRRVGRSLRSDCWKWLGPKNKKGYGDAGGKQGLAHQLAWKIFRGSVPEGMMVLHHCDNPICVNPGHLWLGTAKDNTQDMLEKGRARNGSEGQTHCKRGHLFDEQNTKIEVNGARRCRRCVAIRRRRYQEKR